MGVEDQTAVREALEAAIGTQEVGRHRHDGGIGGQDDVDHRRIIVIERAEEDASVRPHGVKCRGPSVRGRH